MDIDSNEKGPMKLLTLKEMIDAYLDPEMSDDEHDVAFDVIATKVCLVNKRNGIMMVIDDNGDEDKSSSIFNTKHEEVQSNAVHIQDMIEHLQAPLTCDDDKNRHRATLLLAEIFHYKSKNNQEEIMSSTALHVFITFFCRRLADYPSILPSIHALIALISYHASNLDSKFNDVHEIYSAIFTELQVQSLAQSIRQKVFELLLKLLTSSATVIVEEQKFHSTKILEGLIDTFDGEKDPRCLVIGLKVLREGMVQLRAAMTHDLAEKYFNALSCYFPLTFVPAEDDPYGITHEMLIDCLEGSLSADSSLFPYVLPFLFEHLQEDSKLSRIQALNLLLKMCTLNGPTIINHLGKDIGKLVYDIACGVSGDEHGPEVVACALTFITKLSNLISRNIIVHEIVWRNFIEYLLQKASIEVVGNIDLLSTKAAVGVAVAIARGSLVCCKAVMDRLLPVLIPKIRETIGLLNKSIVRAVYEDHGDHCHSHSTASQGGSGGCCQGSGSSSSSSGCCSSPTTISAASLQILIQLLRSYSHRDEEHSASLDFSSMSDLDPLAAFSSDLFLTLQSAFTINEGSEDGSGDDDTRMRITRGEHSLASDAVSCASDCLLAIEETLCRTIPSALSDGALVPFIKLVTRFAIYDVSLLWGGSESVATANPKYEGFRIIASGLLMSLASNTNYDGLLRDYSIPVLIESISSSSSDEEARVYDIVSSIAKQGTPVLLTASLPFICEQCLPSAETSGSVRLSALQALINILPPEPTNETMKTSKNSYDNSRANEIAGFSKKVLVREHSIVIRILLSISAKGEGGVPDMACVSSLCSLVRRLMLLLDRDAQTSLADAIISILQDPLKSRDSGRVCLPVLASLLVYLDKDSPFYSDDARASSVLLCTDHAKEAVVASRDSDDDDDDAFTKQCAAHIVAIVVNKLGVASELDRIVSQVYQLAKGSKSEHSKVLMIWVARALLMRLDVKCSLQRGSSWQDFYSAHMLLSLGLDDGSSFADVFHVLTLAHDHVLSPWGKCNTQLFWKQKLWSRFLPPLLASLKSTNAKEAKEGNYLLAICGLACGVNKSVLESSLDELVLVAVRSLSLSSMLSYRSQCVQLLETLLEFNVEKFSPHVNSIVPELLAVCQREPQAKTRAASLRCLLNLLQLQYHHIHAVKGTVIKGLQKVTDDNKKAIRLLAAKVRNRYITIAT